ncbi:MAG: MBOAT family protein, partial [Coprobacillus sp.]
PFKKFSQFVKAHSNDYISKLLPATTALFFVWITNGLWHGSSLKYVMYGMYYYSFMVIGMFMEPVFKKVLDKLHIKKETWYFKGFQIFRTILIVNIGMLIFRADNLSSAYHMFISCFQNFSLDIGQLAHLGLSVPDILMVIIGVVVVLIVGLIREKGIHIRESVGKWHIIPRWAFYLVGFLVVVIFGAYGRGYDIVSFIYAQF